MRKVVVLINDTTYAYNLRGAILQELIRQEYEVTVVGKELRHTEELKQIGCKLINVETNRYQVNPLSDFKLFNVYCSILQRERPDAVLTYNIKPNVYGGSACKRHHIPYIANVTGLGKPLATPGTLQRAACLLYKKGISGAACVFFQNESNRQFFIEHNMLDEKQQYNRVLPGSGVDLDRFPYLEYPENDEIHFLYVARIMKEKGIDYLLEAANQFANEEIIFDVCGPCEDKDYLQIIKNDPKIHYYGEQDDLRPFYQQCSCFLFPSYYPEGMSNVLLEAASSGRPVITTDSPGCREIVKNRINGYIVPLKDSEALLKTVEKFLSLTREQRKAMGQESRRIVEEQFDRKIVVSTYIEMINRICLIS